jgi:hypothetical protein
MSNSTTEVTDYSGARGSVRVFISSHPIDEADCIELTVQDSDCAAVVTLTKAQFQEVVSRMASIIREIGADDPS